MKRDFMAPESERAMPNLDDCVFHVHLRKRTDEKGGEAYVAHVLELDIVAVDNEPWHAMEKLALLVNRQINFAIKNKRLEAIWFPAPQKYFDEATKPNEPTLTCSEVVERLKWCFTFDADGIWRHDDKKATAILHSWRERRVQELEELIAKHSLTPEPQSTQLDTDSEKK